MARDASTPFGQTTCVRAPAWPYCSRDHRAKLPDGIVVATESGEATARLMRSLVHAEDLAMVDESAAKAQKGLPSPPFEHRIKRPNGDIRLVHSEAEVIPDTDGKPLSRVIMMMDVTDRRAAEAFQKETEEHRQRLADQARCDAERVLASAAHLASAQRLAGVGSISRDFRTGDVEWTGEVYHILGLDPGTPPNYQLFRSLVHPDDVAKIDGSADRVKKGLPDPPFEYRIIRPDGQMRYIHRENEVVTDASSNSLSRVTTMMDITDRRTGEARRNELERELQHSQKLEALGTLAGGIAHDLNNTLVPILALSQMTLEELGEDSPIRTDVETIYIAAERARDLVRRVLAFSRKQDRALQEVDLAPVTHEALRMMRSSLPATIEIKAAIADVPLVAGDPGELHQVIINLITNAAQAIGDDGGRITVALSQTEPGLDARDTAVCLSVTDTGCGMDEATLSRIFEPFYTTKDVGSGTGLGLSLVHGIVTSHNGEIKVRSKPSEGTEFRVTFPVHSAPNEATIGAVAAA